MSPLDLLSWLAFASVVVTAAVAGFILGLWVAGIFRLAVQVSERQEQQRRLAEAERRRESEMPQARLIAALSALNRLPRDPVWQRRFLAGLQAQWWPNVAPLVAVDSPLRRVKAAVPGIVASLDEIAKGTRTINVRPLDDQELVREIQDAIRIGVSRLKH